MKYVLSTSHGRDSMAMLLLVLQEPEKYPLDAVIWCDMGRHEEFSCIRNNSAKVSRLLQSKDIPYFIVRPQVPFFAGFFGNRFIPELKTVCLSQEERLEILGTKGNRKPRGFCGGPCRHMTAEKLNGIYHFLRNWSDGEPVTEYIGIAYDERERDRSFDVPKKPVVKIRYPLIEAKITAEEALQKCHQAGIDWKDEEAAGNDLYEIGLRHVSCRHCGNKCLSEYRVMRNYLPTLYSQFLELEKYSPMRKLYHGQSLASIEQRFQDEEKQLTINDV